MALFGLKKTKVETAAAPVKAEKKVVAKKASKPVVKKVVKTKGDASSHAHPVSFSHLILRPRVTEKAGIANETNNVYTFEVNKEATKNKISHAITQLYKVTPVKINIVNLPRTAVFIRGKKGTQSAIKKALVFLKKGDKIEVA